MAHKISPEVETILRGGACSAASFTIQTHLDRKMYDAVNKVLDLSGFKWDRKSKKHLATNGNAADTLAKALGDGKIVDPQKEFDFFQTPEDLALRMAEALSPDGNSVILEPSAGGGRLCRAIIDWAPKLLKISKDQIYFFEIQENLHDALFEDGFRPLGYDFLECNFSGYFTHVVGNPPFSNAQDLAHFRKMYDCLKSGGRMVCITSPSWQWRTQKKFVEFKTWFQSLRYTTVEPLPDGTFKDSGTNVPALLITVDKE